MPRKDEFDQPVQFPVQGLDLVTRLADIQPEMTHEGHNVRGHEPMTGRRRGGSRAGLSKLFDDALGGEIQCLDTVVRTDANAIPFSFAGVEYGNPGVHTGIGSPDEPTTPPIYLDDNDGGGGYQPNQGTTYYITLTPATQKGPADGTTERTLTATVRDSATDDPHAFIGVELLAAPRGRDGDGDHETTIFDLSDPPHGTAPFEVTNNRAETVYYMATAEVVAGQPIASRIVKIVWKPYKLVAISSEPTAGLGEFVIITGTLTDLNGDPVVGATLQLGVTGSGSGDGSTAVTNASGQATFSVTNFTAETSTYTINETGEDVDNELANPTVVWTGTKFVQSQGGSGFLQAGIALTFDESITTGNLLVLCFSWFGTIFDTAPTTPATVTDSLGNIYTLIQSQSFDGPASGSRVYGAMYYAENATGGSASVTFTGTIQAGYTVSLTVLEFRGVLAAGVLFDSTAASGNAHPVSAGAPAIDASGDLIVAYMANNQGTMALTNPDFTDRTPLPASFSKSASYDSATAASNCSWLITYVFTPDWVAMAASFKQD